MWTELPESLPTAVTEEPADRQQQEKQGMCAGSGDESLAAERQNGKSGDEERIETSKVSEPEPRQASSQFLQRKLKGWSRWG